MKAKQMERRHPPAVYEVRVIVDGVLHGIYIGSSMEGAAPRMYHHLYLCATNAPSANTGLCDAYWRHGPRALQFRAVQEFPYNYSKEQLRYDEQHIYSKYVEQYGREMMLNTTDGGYRGKPNRPASAYHTLWRQVVAANSVSELARLVYGDESALRKLLDERISFHAELVRTEEEAEELGYS